ncbi:hypothetical protein FE697_017280 [Mumia zhuanghuii]|uniref:Antitoxin FitA-like ribbon-helix-helix domain-containing protein n=2 Tax=Mumia TaxID=1546255 RepID=A0A5Q6RRL9_9ACTN|nr:MULTISPECIES: hypothetical protein [Mumia]KAA1420691.1 hypothetical protein FE697_017280 [Mumia zhuanghuii]
MAMLQLKRLPDDLHAALRERAEAEDLSMSDFVIRLLRAELAVPSRRAWLDDVASHRPEEPLGLDIEQVMDDVRESER